MRSSSLTRFHELSGLAAPLAPPPGDSTVPNTPPDADEGLAQPTTSGIVSSARRTLAVGPRYRQVAAEPPRAVAEGTSRSAMVSDEAAASDGDDMSDDTLDRDATHDEMLPTGPLFPDPPFGPIVGDSPRGGMGTDPSVDCLLPLPPPPDYGRANGPAASVGMGGPGAGPGSANGAGPGRGGPPAPGSGQPLSAAPPGPPPPPGAPGRPPGSGGPPSGSGSTARFAIRSAIRSAAGERQGIRARRFRSAGDDAAVD